MVVTAIQRQDKELLQRYIAENSPAAARWHYYLAESLAELRKDEAAAAAYLAASASATNSEEAAWSLYKAAVQLYTVGKRDEAMALALQALGKNPGIVELPWVLGFWSYEGMKYAEAVSWAMMAASLGCFKGICLGAKTRWSYREPWVWFEGPYFVLHYAYTRLED